MRSATVRIGPEAHQALKELSKLTGASMQDLLDRAIEEQRRKCFFDKLDAGYEEMKRNPATVREFRKELAAWDVTLGDGLKEKHGKSKSRRRVARRS